MRPGAKPKQAWISREAAAAEVTRLVGPESLRADVLARVSEWHRRRYAQAVRLALRRLAAGLRELEKSSRAAKALLWDVRDSAGWTGWHHAGSSLWAEADALRSGAEQQLEAARDLTQHLAPEPPQPAAQGAAPHHRRACFEVLRHHHPAVARSDTTLAYWEIGYGLASGARDAADFRRRVDTWKAVRRAAARAS